MRTAVLASVCVPVPALASGPAEDPGAVLERIVRPELLNEATITYPPALAELESPPVGSVVVKFTIGTDGVPKELAVLEGLHPELDALALAAVAKLRYRPAMLDGDAIEVVNRIAIAFTPPEPEPEPEPEPPPDAAVRTPEPVPDDEEPPPQAELGPVRIDGVILEAGQRTPIEGATVLAVPAREDAELGHVRKRDYTPESAPAWTAGATTDPSGAFALRGVPGGKVKLVVIAPGFERIEFIEALPEGEALSVKYFVTRSPSNPYRTEVMAENPREEVARRSITVAEINAIPGTQGDALKSIQNFPGVARSPFGIGFLAIRGTGANDSAIYLGYHEIPTLFHFGGITSVFNSDILERIDFIPGNFDPRYGDAIGGVVDVTPRAGRRDGYHGYVDSDVFDTGVLVEGKVGKGSFALSGRRSYIDVLLPVFVPDDAGLDLTVAPRYYDYQALFDYPVGGGTLKIRGFGSDDRTVLVAANPNDVDVDDRNQFETTSYFHRADIIYEKRHGPWFFLITPSYRYDYFDLGIGGLLDIKTRAHNLNGRAEVRRRLGSRAALTVGTEYQSYWYQADVEAPPLPNADDPGSNDERLSTTTHGFTAIPALYAQVALDVTPSFTLYPGVRAAYYTAPFQVATFDPRVRFGWQVAENTTLKGGVGLYSQGPTAVEANRVFGNPRVGPERSLQTSIGVAHKFPFDITLDATVFFNYLFDGVVPSAGLVHDSRTGVAAERYANTEVGRVYGLEVLVRKALTRNVFGWLSYTLFRSERRDRPGEPYHLFDFDQTHMLTLIGVYKLPKNWQVGARFRLISGNPYRPVIDGVYDANQGSYIPVYGAPNSERMPMFHQLDIRVDKKWIWKRLSFMVYLDVLNVYNAQNVEFWNRSFDQRSRNAIPSLPIIPSLGFKLEF